MESGATMYLVELRPGKEELYRTGDELAAAIRSGDVDVHSRIYHRATSKWISVTLHPQYKAIVAEQRPAAKPLPPLERSTWTFFNDSADTLEGAHDPEPDAPRGAKDDSDNHPWRRPLALSITGGLLILGLQLAATGPRPPWAHHSSGTSSGVLRPASGVGGQQGAPTVSLASNRTNWIEDDAAFVTTSAVSEPAAPAAAEAPRPTHVLPVAPRIRTKTLRDALPKAEAAPAVDSRTVTGLMQRWKAAHDSARARLESGIRVARLNQLFSPGRLGPAGGVTETRMSLAGVANFVRVYRQQQVTIDRDYQDAFAKASKDLAWTPTDIREWQGKPDQKESQALAALTTSLIAGIDSLLGVLDAQAGTYLVTKNTIRFEDPSAAREYATLRQRIGETLNSATAAGGATSPGPLSYLLQAIGTTHLPRAI
jgi:hypothetical protein